MVLIGLYIVYILIITRFKPEMAPAMPEDSSISRKKEVMNALLAIIPPLALIVIVLGSIFTGIATPTESSALGGIGAIVLAIIYRQFSFKMVWGASKDTVKVTAMVFAILVGATAFSMVFSYTGGDYLLEEWMLALPGEKWGFIILAMLVIYGAGFLHRFCRNLLHHRAHSGASGRSLGHQHALVCHSYRHEPANQLPDPTFRVLSVLLEGGRTTGSANDRHLQGGASVHPPAGVCAGTDCDFPRVVRHEFPLTSG